MKKSILFLSTILIGLLTFISCGEEEIVKDVNSLKLSVKEISVSIGEKGEVKILEGNGSYIATVSNDKVKASVKDRVIVIEGISFGDAEVTITDAEKKISKLIVKVLAGDLSLTKKNLTIKKGGLENIEILKGSGDFEVISADKKIAVANLKDRSIEIKAIASGKTTIKVIDRQTKKEVVVEVIVSVEALVVSTKSIVVGKGLKESITITAGSGVYKVISKDVSIATVVKTGDKFEVTGVKKGKTKVVITDEKSKLTKEVDVEVSVEALIINLKSVTVKKGLKKSVSITAGSGVYKVVSKDVSIATVVKTGNNFEITGVKKGKTKVVVTDVESKLTKEVDVEVSVDALAISVKNVTVKKGLKKSVSITAGSGVYKVVSKDVSIATVVKTGNKFEITGVKKGKTKIIVTDVASKLTKEVDVEVSVEALVVDETNTNIVLRETKIKKINITSGSGNYEVVSDKPNVATVELKGTSVVITAKEGNDLTAKTAKITIKDVGSSTVKVFTVKVFKNLSIGSSNYTLIQGDYKSTPIVSGNIEAIKLVVDDASKVLVDAKIVEGAYGQEVKVTAKKPGKAKIIVKDGELEKIITVTITAAPALKIMDGSKEITAITLNMGDDKTLKIKGSSQYKIDVATKNIIEALTIDNSGFMTVKAKTVGTTTVKITDKITGDVKSFSVKVNLVLKPLVFTYKKGGVLTKPTSYDDEGDAVFKVKVGDVIKVSVSGGSGSGYFIGGLTKPTMLGFEGVVISGGRKTLPSAYVNVEMKEVGDVYFFIKDPSGKMKYVTFKIAKAGKSIDMSNYIIDDKGRLTGIKDAAINTGGKLFIPLGVNQIGLGNGTFLTNNQKKKLKEVEISNDEDSVVIANYAFAGAALLAKVNLGSKVKSLGMFSFKNTIIELLIINSSTPPSLKFGKAFYVFSADSDIPKNVYKDGKPVLKVPSASKAAYASWKTAKTNFDIQGL